MSNLKKKSHKLISSFLVLMMAFLLVGPSITAFAATKVEDKISVGDPAFEAGNVMRYSSCLGSGETKYKSIVISFTSIREYGEIAVLPTAGVDGFKYERDLSNDATYVVNMAEGKTLAQIASYIRKIQFKNCERSSSEIKFSIGRNIVKFKTSYCEDTKHFYQFVPFDSSLGAKNSSKTMTLPDGTTVKAPFMNWHYAYFYSLTQEYEGLQGYLVAVSGVEEDAFLYKNMGEVGWMSATRLKPIGTVKNSKGVGYYTAFNDYQTGGQRDYWYWASGPETLTSNNGKFLTSNKGTNSLFDSNKRDYGYYNNWASGEPNGNYPDGECCATTLKWGTPYTSSSLPSNNKYYIAPTTWANVQSGAVRPGYGWNDLVPTQGAAYGTNEQYTPTGFFIEYGVSDTVPASDASQGFTGFVFNTTTKPLVHTWEAVRDSDDPSKVDVYCTRTGADRCSYYGTSTNHPNCYTVDLNAPNMPYSNSAYNLGEALNTEETKTATTSTTTSISYYKVNEYGVTTDKTNPVTGAPKEIGYYFAEITVVPHNTSGANTSATAVCPFKIYDPNVDFDIETLNNQINDDGRATNTIHDESEAVSDLKINLSNPSDASDMEIYRIADMKWTGSVLGDMTWVDVVSHWIEEESDRKQAYGTTPEALNGTSQSTQKSFFNELLKTTDDNVLTGLAKGTHAGEKITEQIAEGTDYDSTEYNYTKDGEASTEGDGGILTSVTLKNIKLGTYAIVVPNKAVTIANIYPQTRGSKTTYTIEKLFEVSIKEAEPTVTKTINGAKEDDLYIGEKASFDIDFQLPEYADRIVDPDSSKRITGEAASYFGGNIPDIFKESGYILSFVDTLDKAYNIDASSIKVSYYWEKATITDEATDTGYQLIYTNGDNDIPTASPYQFYASAISGSTATPAGDSITKNTDLQGKSYYKQRENTSLFDGISVNETLNASTGIPSKDTVITINFDEPAARAYAKTMTDGKILRGYRVSYEATLNKQAVVGNAGNPNKASVVYEKSSIAGKAPEEMFDTVYGYTYGVKIIKKDGNTSGADTKWLSGAKFKLYKEVIAFATKDEAEEYIESHKDDLIYDGSTVKTDFYLYEYPLATDESLNQFIADIEEMDKTEIEGVDKTEGNIYRVFKWVTIENGDFETIKVGDVDTNTYIMSSVASEAGVICHGLKNGKYVMVETQAPSGYNELAEDVYFEINRLTKDEEIEHTYTLAQFRELTNDNNMDDPYNKTGIIDLTVLNYQGLTLPSTGGMGILIFIIIGCTIMVATIVFIIIKKRSVAEYEF